MLHPERMSFLLAIEGADGAGKATATAAVARRLRAAGIDVTTLSFPRYADTAGGWMLGEYLGGRVPRAVSPRAAAVLYALDRFESLGALTAAMADNEVVVLDRYIASNMAYQAAQVAPDEGDALMAWIVGLETQGFGLPAPDLSVHLDTPPDVARAQMLTKRKRAYTDDAFDAYEADDALQSRVRANYATLARGALLGRWATVLTVRDGVTKSPDAIADEIVAAAFAALDPPGTPVA